MFGLLVAALVVSALLTVRSRTLLSRESKHRQGIVALQALLFYALCVSAFIFIASEDDYRSDGRSRWEVYGGHGWVVAAIAAALAVAHLAPLAARRGGSVVALIGPAGMAAAALSYVAFILNTSN